MGRISRLLERARHRTLYMYGNESGALMKSLHLVNSKSHQLVQVADLLTGSVYGHASGVQNPVKRAIADRIAEMEGVQNLLDRRLDRSRKFRVWRFRLSRSKERR
jgi:hypothetical protein